MNRKISCLLLVFVILFYTLIPISGQLPALGASWNNASSWAIDSLLRADTLGLITERLAYADFTEAISREEFCELGLLLFETVTGKTVSLPDVNPFTDTDNILVLMANAIGITTGTSHDKFSPDLLITREQCAVMLFNTIKATNPIADFSVYNTVNIPDQTEISSWALEPVRFIAGYGIIKGNEHGMFMPKPLNDSSYGMATREQAVIMVLQAYDAFPKIKTLETVSIVGDSYIYLGMSQTDFFEQFGQPDRIDISEYSFNWLVYNYLDTYLLAGTNGYNIVAYQIYGKDFIFENRVSYQDYEAENISNEMYTAEFLRDNIAGFIFAVSVKNTGYTTNYNKDGLASAFEQEIFDLVNVERHIGGFAPFLWSDSVAEVARSHSIDMFERKYFDHTTPEGLEPQDRLLKAGLDYRICSENIAAGHLDALEVHAAWMNSEGHRKNIFADMKYLGVGVFLYGNYDHYYTQNFYEPF